MRNLSGLGTIGAGHACLSLSWHKPGFFAFQHFNQYFQLQTLILAQARSLGRRC